MAKKAETNSPNSGTVALYVGAIVLITLFSIVGILTLIFLRPSDADNVVVIATIVGIVTPILVSLMAMIQRENHLTMNSRLGELLEVTASAAKAEGKLQGAEAAKK